jgi:hypothetical protein
MHLGSGELAMNAKCLQPLKKMASSMRHLTGLVILACITSLSAQRPVSGQVITDLNSTATVSPVTQLGVYSWNVDGVNQLHQEWFWYSLGPAGAGTPPSSIDKLPLIGDTQPTANTLNLTYQGAGFTLSTDFTLTGGTPGSGVSDLGESIRITNQSGAPLPFQFYEYSDFDLGGVPGPDTATLSNALGGGFNGADQTMGSTALSETVDAPAANFGETAPEFATLAKLNNGSVPVVLNDNPTASGNVTWALQWNFNIATGSSVLISKDKDLQTNLPEPTSIALLSVGAAALLVRRRDNRPS